ncbi:hypothetical protein FANTH_1401 [Fusarium anthophilum]|uniref:DUF6536 domain-containing protein n=1 Tax=Fusarium anthophilum TaxID=48485 RepID=A0A8H4ZVX6_9HYPO|nr:hypothetical protein FANTH_1401 [Fusarium anthophilum]
MRVKLKTPDPRVFSFERQLGVADEISSNLQTMSFESPHERLDGANSPGEGEGEDGSLLQSLVPGIRSDRYANADYLAKYVPEFEHENLRPKNMRHRMSKVLKMLKLQTLVATLIFAAQLGVTIWSIKAYPPDTRGTGTFFWGDCSTIGTANKLIHVALNVASTIFLTVGHYCMQILVAPTRSEVDFAHGKGKAMEVGVPSLKNLRHIAIKRVAGWIMLSAVATLLHVFWNSSIFTSLPITVLPIAVATSDFQIAVYNWTNSNPLSLRLTSFMPGHEDEQRSMIYALQTAASAFTRISVEDCVKLYVDPRKPTSPLVVVAGNLTAAQNNGSSLVDGGVVGWLGWEWSSVWICEAYQPKKWRYCNWEFAKTFASRWALGQQGQIRKPHWMGREEQALATSGDAIQSFLDSPQTRKGTHERSSKTRGVELAVAQWNSQSRTPWFKAISPAFWTISLVLFVAALSGCSYVAWSSIHGLRTAGVDTSISAIWNNGFQVNPSMIASELPGSLSGIDKSGTAALLANIFIANSPQVMVSFLYIFYNSILTRQLVADEFVRFLREDGKRALRVTFPVVSTALHWFISQSIFLVQSSSFSSGPNGVRIPGSDYSARGYTVGGSITSLVVGLVALVALLINSFGRSYHDITPGFERVGFHTMAIQGVCQRPDSDFDAAFFPVRIGTCKYREKGNYTYILSSSKGKVDGTS